MTVLPLILLALIPAQRSTEDSAVAVRAALEICEPVMRRRVPLDAAHPAFLALGAVRLPPSSPEDRVFEFSVEAGAGPSANLTVFIAEPPAENTLEHGCSVTTESSFLPALAQVLSREGWQRLPTDETFMEWSSADFAILLRATDPRFGDEPEPGMLLVQEAPSPKLGRERYEAIVRNSRRSAGQAAISGIENLCTLFNTPRLGETALGEAHRAWVLMDAEFNGATDMLLHLRHRPSDDQAVLFNGDHCGVGVGPEGMRELRAHLDSRQGRWSPVSGEPGMYADSDGLFLRLFSQGQGEDSGGIAFVGSREALTALRNPLSPLSVDNESR